MAACSRFASWLPWCSPRAVCLLCWPKRIPLPATKSPNKMKELATIQRFHREKAVWELLREGPAPGEGYLAAAQAIGAGSWGFGGCHPKIEVFKPDEASLTGAVQQCLEGMNSAEQMLFSWGGNKRISIFRPRLAPPASSR